MRVKATEATAVSRTGDSLTRERVRGYAIILLVLEIAIFSFFVAGTHGWIVPLATPTTTDFVSFYAAGSLADQGTPALAYDHAAHLAAEEAVAGRGIEYQFFNYPPVYQALFAPIAYLPYLAAFVAFVAVTLLFYLAIARRILDDYGSTALIALLAFPSVWWTIGLGQNAFLTAGLFGGATLLLDRRPVIAGMLFGALCYKPHFALLVPLALAAGSHWRAFAAAAASAAALILLSVGLFGWETWRVFLETAGASHSMYESGRIVFGGIVSPFGAVRLMGGGIALAYTIQAGFSLVAASVVVVAWRQNVSLPTRAAVLAAATLVAIPLALLYDLMLATIAACWLLRADTKTPLAGWEKLVLAAAYPALLCWRGLNEISPVPIVTICALAMFAIATRHVWLELDRASLWRRQAT